MRYKQTQRNGIGFWLLVILLHITAINLDKIKSSCPKALAGKYRRSLHLEKAMTMGKFPIVTVFSPERKTQSVPNRSD